MCDTHYFISVTRGVIFDILIAQNLGCILNCMESHSLIDFLNSEMQVVILYLMKIFSHF